MKKLYYELKPGMLLETDRIMHHVRMFEVEEMNYYVVFKKPHTELQTFFVTESEIKSICDRLGKDYFYENDTGTISQ